MAALPDISPTQIEPGNFVLVLGDDEVKGRLRTMGGKIDDWLYELADSISFFAAERLRDHAPGHIDELVDVDLANPDDHPGSIQAVAGVMPGLPAVATSRGTSDPADYPLFVDVGTGIYGARHSPISIFPGLMGPIPWRNREIFVHSIKGQRAQHYSDKAFDETTAWTPVQIELAMPDLERRIKT